MTVQEFRVFLQSASSSTDSASIGDTGGAGGIVLDIDETLSATNVAWFERCIELFGNPDELTVSELIDKYHLAQNNPHWSSLEEARLWMQEQRDSPRAQDDLPLIPGSVEAVKRLETEGIVKILGYLTVRPEKVSGNTVRWLRQNDFPDVPVISKPNDVPFSEGNRWKASALR